MESSRTSQKQIAEHRDFRTQPYDPEAEEAVIGAMMLSDRAIYSARAILKVSDFFKERNQKFYTAISSLTDRADKIDPITLAAELRRTKDFENVGGSTEITRIMDNVPTAANVDYYCAIVKEHSVRRSIIRSAEMGIAAAYSAERPAMEVAEQLVNAIVTGEYHIDAGDPAALASEAYEEVTDEKKNPYIPIGFGDYDERIGGAKRGKMTVITGQQEQGKSTFAMNVALNIAKSGKRVTYLYLDDSPKVLIRRQICIMQGWKLSKLESYDATICDPVDKAKAFSAWTELGIRAQGQKQVGVDFNRLKFWLLRECQQHKPDAVFIDPMDRITNKPNYGEDYWAAQSRMVNELENICQETDIALWVVVGQSAETKDRMGKKIENDNEAGSSAWRKNARIRMKVNRHDQHEDISIVKITKNSDGPKGSFYFQGDRDTYKWKQLPKGEIAEQED